MEFLNLWDHCHDKEPKKAPQVLNCALHLYLYECLVCVHVCMHMCITSDSRSRFSACSAAKYCCKPSLVSVCSSVSQFRRQGSSESTLNQGKIFLFYMLQNLISLLMKLYECPRTPSLVDSKPVLWLVSMSNKIREPEEGESKGRGWNPAF